MIQGQLQNIACLLQSIYGDGRSGAKFRRFSHLQFPYLIHRSSKFDKETDYGRTTNTHH